MHPCPLYPTQKSRFPMWPLLSLAIIMFFKGFTPISQKLGPIVKKWISDSDPTSKIRSKIEKRVGSLFTCS